MKKTTKKSAIDEQLFAAFSSERDHELIEDIIKSKEININSRDEEGWQFIHHAAEHGLTSIIELLVEKGADVNAKIIPPDTHIYIDQNNWTPLHVLANSQHCKNAEAAQALIRMGADLNSQDDYGNTPLLVLGDKKIHQKLALLFMDSGADINATNKYDDNLFCLKMKTAPQDFMKELLRRKVNLKGKPGLKSLCQAIESLDKSFIDFLLQQNIKVTSTSLYCPLAGAARRGDISIFNMLIKKGADLEKDKYRVMEEIFLSQGDQKILQQILESCLKAGADFTKKYANIINIAAELNAKWAIKLLVQYGANINHLDKDKLTPLRHAARNSNVEMIEELIKHGADISQDSALAALIFSSGPAVAQTLIKAGVNLNKLYDGYTPLQSEVDKLQVARIKLYLENGADPNIYGKKKKIPLVQAINKSRSDIVQLLLLHGADKNIKIDAKTTIADLAEKSKDVGLAALFKMDEGELKSYKVERSYLRFTNKHLLFTDGPENWNPVIQSQIKKIFGKMPLNAVEQEVGEIEYFDVVTETGKPLYQLVLFNYGDGALFAYNKTSVVGEIIQHGFDVYSPMSEDAENELRNMLEDAYGNFEGKIRQSVNFYE